MKFFFPDSHDHVDPSFDFVHETTNPHRIPQRDDLYAHEILDPIPYQGLLVSKGIVDGLRGAMSAKYTMGQRRRFMSLGGRGFFRLPPQLQLMGDCGAFTYRNEDVPPYTVDEVLSFYDGADVDYGISVDHVILAFEPDLLPGIGNAKEHQRRQEITLTLAAEFLKTHAAQKLRFKPMGVAQGWSPASYAHAVSELQRMGYDYIAMGGMVPLKTQEILASLAAVDDVRRANTGLHLLGITRLERLAAFQDHGVVSLDSTSPLMQGIKDESDNYWTLDGTYTSVGLPDPEGNPRMNRLILSGQVSSDVARVRERAAFAAVLAYDRGEIPVDAVVEAIHAYECLDPARKDRRPVYRKVLVDQPWRCCPCKICKEIGIHVILKRSAARNRRRGFHNLHVFGQRLERVAALARDDGAGST